MEIAAILTLSGIVIVQFMVIWRLIDRLLVRASIPPLGPVRTTPPEQKPEQPESRRKLFSVPMED